MRHNLQLRSFAGLAVLALATLPVLTACSGDSVTNPKTTGQFTATVAGAIQSSLSGDAAVVPVAATVVDSTQVPAGLILGLVDRTTQAVVAFQWQGTATATVGTYTVGQNLTDVGMVFDTGTGTAGSTFDGVSGTVTINTVSGGTASGTFTVTATAHDTGAQVTVSGAFSAPTIIPGA